MLDSPQAGDISGARRYILVLVVLHFFYPRGIYYAIEREILLGWFFAANHGQHTSQQPISERFSLLVLRIVFTFLKGSKVNDLKQSG